MIPEIALMDLDPRTLAPRGVWIDDGNGPQSHYADPGGAAVGAVVFESYAASQVSGPAAAQATGSVRWSEVSRSLGETAEQLFTRVRGIHNTYLPFGREQLLQHFAQVAGPASDHAKYYSTSALRAAAHICVPAGRRGCSDSLAHQIEKDERFWIATALLSLFYRHDRIGAFADLLAGSLGKVPPVSGLSTWEEALGDPEDLRVYFEVNLPAPSSYKKWMATHYESRTLTKYQRNRAAHNAGTLEGATKVDALLIAPRTGFAVIFEAKVFSDTSTSTDYNAARNQLARNIDVLLDDHPSLLPPLDMRIPDRTCFVLVTPNLFKEDPTTRLYGTLMQAYGRDSALLEKHLPHRDPEMLGNISERLGWATWEQVEALSPSACPWLAS